ncbi:hypothetical protein C5S30_07825 [ANME-1 cluster archaeon GoMg4]|nr:hypothetical protein [ANME-1 cluster archaeon GoMg4]
MSILEAYRKEIGHLIEGDVLDKPFPKPKIDEGAREEAIKYAGSFRGGVGITHGYFYTDEEREKRKQELLNVKLP